MSRARGRSDHNIPYVGSSQPHTPKNKKNIVPYEDTDASSYFMPFRYKDNSKRFDELDIESIDINTRGLASPVRSINPKTSHGAAAAAHSLGLSLDELSPRR